MNPSLAVIGLGNMGSALAGRLLEFASSVHVWDRTAAKAAPLEARGVCIAATPEAAAAAADIVICCFSNYRDCLGAMAGCRDRAGKTLVQLTTGTAADADRFKGWTVRRGAHYLDGVILAYPSEIGAAQTKGAWAARACTSARTSLRRLRSKRP